MKWPIQFFESKRYIIKHDVSKFVGTYVQMEDLRQNDTF
jgi:hypothetical protein